MMRSSTRPQVICKEQFSVSKKSTMSLLWPVRHSAWPVVVDFRSGFHRRDHYFFSQAVSFSVLSTTLEPRPCEPILSPNYELATS